MRQVLTHTASFGDVTDHRWPTPEYDGGALERYVRGLADSTLIAAPGEKWAYSNIGFEVLADVVAKVSGLSFEDYIGLSWFLPVRGRHHLVTHSGGDTGFQTDLVLVRAEQVAIVVLTNGDRTDPGALSTELSRVLLATGQP